MSGPAVVAGGWIGTPDRRRIELPNGWRSDDVAAAAESLGASVVYVAEMTGMTSADGHGLRLDGTPAGPQPDELRPWRIRSGNVTLVDIHAPGGDQAGPFEGCDAGELLGVFAVFEGLTGVEWSHSLGNTAERLILATHPRAKGGVRLDQSPYLPEPVLEPGLEQPFASWRRALTLPESRAAFVHAFDANAQYLAAWGVAELGHGRPVHHDAPAFAPAMAGVWRIPSAGGVRTLEPWGELLPLPWDARREWFTTPTVRRMLEVADGLELAHPFITEGWVWPHHSRFLRGAAERLRDARQTARERRARAGELLGQADAHDVPALRTALREIVVGDTVADCVKAMYAIQTGRFNMAARDERSGWKRPDWGHTVRAQARVNLHRRLTKLGAYPFAIATDGLLFASDEPDAHAFALRIGLPVGEGLGQFTHDATAPAGPVRDALEDNPRGVLHLFAAVAEGSTDAG